MISVFMTEPCPRRERSFVCQTQNYIWCNRWSKEKEWKGWRGEGWRRRERVSWNRGLEKNMLFNAKKKIKLKDKDHYERAWMAGESYTCVTTTFPDLVSIATATPFLLRDSPERKGREEAHWTHCIRGRCASTRWRTHPSHNGCTVMIWTVQPPLVNTVTMTNHLTAFRLHARFRGRRLYNVINHSPQVGQTDRDLHMQ